MGRTIRLLMLCEGATFAVASLIHSGVVISGHEHAQARIAEGVIAGVLFAAVASTWIWPTRTPVGAFAAQAFALLGTLVGLFTIAIGIGPRTVPDIVYHVAIAAVLVRGLMLARRAR